MVQTKNPSSGKSSAPFREDPAAFRRVVWGLGSLGDVYAHGIERVQHSPWQWGRPKNRCPRSERGSNGGAPRR
jgi:hypothetical protein